MRKYEVMFIINPNLSEEETAAVIERTQNLMAEQGAANVETSKWGKRKLAYPIEKITEGFYVVINFEAEVKAKQEIDRKMKLDEQIVRHMIVRLDEE